MENKTGKITIKEITEFTYSGGAKKGWNIISGDDVKYSTFSVTVQSALASIKALGAEATIRYKEGENKQGYMTRTIDAVADDAGNFPEKAAGAPSGGFRGAPKDNESIERQVALKEASELCRTDKIKFAEILPTAEDFAAFLHKRSQ